jgi:hypothetical protein
VATVFTALALWFSAEFLKGPDAMFLTLGTVGVAVLLVLSKLKRRTLAYCFLALLTTTPVLALVISGKLFEKVVLVALLINACVSIMELGAS